MIILFAQSIPFSNTLISFTFISDLYFPQLFSNLEILLPSNFLKIIKNKIA